MNEIRRGDIFLEVDLSGARGSVQQGVRPCVVVSNDICNKFSPVITVVPITTQSKQELPTHMEIDSRRYGLKKPSILLAEQVTTVDKTQLNLKSPKTLSSKDIKRLNSILRTQLALA